MKRIVVFALVLNAALLGVIAHQLVAIAGGGAVATQNGDTNGDGARDITDAVYLLSWLFQGGDEPVALAQQGGNDEEVAQLRAMVNNMFRDFEGLREDLHPVAFSGNYEELENVPAAQGGECCEQEYSWLMGTLTTGSMINWGPGVVEEGLGGVNHHNFNGASLGGVEFDPETELNNCSFRNADLRGARLPDQMYGADFRGANLAGARLGVSFVQYTHARGSNFEGANLEGATLGHQSYAYSNFRGVDLSNTVHAAGRIELQFSNMSNTNLANADFARAFLVNVDLTKANLSGTNLMLADLRGADLTGANVQDADFRDAIGLNLEGTIGTPAFMPND